MTNKELKKLTRTELLELLLAQTERADNLEKEIKELKQKLSQREIAIQNSGSIAEAALKINDIFNAAQAAADQYLQNIKDNPALPGNFCATEISGNKQTENNENYNAVELLPKDKPNICDNGVNTTEENTKSEKNIHFESEKNAQTVKISDIKKLKVNEENTATKKNARINVNTQTKENLKAVNNISKPEFKQTESSNGRTLVYNKPVLEDVFEEFDEF